MRSRIRDWFDQFFGDDFNHSFEQLEKEANDLKNQIKVKNSNGHIDIEIKGQIKSVKINGHRIDIRPRL